MDKSFEKALFSGILIFLGCYFVKLFNMHNLVSVAVSTFLCAVLLIKQKKIRIDVTTGLLAVAMAVYFIIDMDIIRMLTSHYFYEVMAMFVLGYYVAYEIKNSDNYQKKFERLLMIFVVAITLRGILNSYMFFTKQWLDGYLRIWKDFWTSQYINGTTQVILYIPALAAMIPAILFFKKNKIYNTSIIIFAVFLLYVSLVSQSRTTIFMLPVVALIQIVVYLLINKEILKRYLNKKSIIILISIVTVGVAVLTLIMMTTSVGKSFIGIMGRNGGIFNNVRFEIQKRALEQLFVYPMGGNFMDHLGYDHTHNLWLHIADIGGVIPFFAFALYTVIIFCENILFVKKSNLDLKHKLIMVGLHAAYLMYFTIAVAITWHVSFVTPWIFLNGLVHGYVKKEKKLLKENRNE